jgi:hypothetical protein
MNGLHKNEASEEPELRIETKHLAKVIEHMSESLDRLTIRLAPVLRSEPELMEADGTSICSKTPLGKEIREARERIERLVCVVMRLNHLIEV